VVCAIVVCYIVVPYEANKYTCHAEKDAIMKIRNKTLLKDCKVYVGRIKYGMIETATPCNMCGKLLNKYGVKRTYRI
jgi:deoxycytidylate deaminase